MKLAILDRKPNSIYRGSRMSSITVHRENRELMGKELSANTLASFLIAQGVASVADLRRESLMRGDLLRFLNRDRALGYWCDQGWLIRDGSGYRLTRDGHDEVCNREEGVAINEQGRKKPGNVSPELVRVARQRILDGSGNADGAVLRREFDIE
jgi:hypothetical protein